MFAEYYLEDCIEMLQFMPPPNDRNKKKGRGDDDDGEEGGEDDVSLLLMMTGFILCHQLDFFVVMNIVFLYVIFHCISIMIL